MALHHKVIAATTGSQSHLIVAAVLFSFFVWVTLRGNLRGYLNDLGIGAAPTPAPAASTVGTTVTTPNGNTGRVVAQAGPVSIVNTQPGVSTGQAVVNNILRLFGL